MIDMKDIDGYVAVKTDKAIYMKAESFAALLRFLGKEECFEVEQEYTTDAKYIKLPGQSYPAFPRPISGLSVVPANTPQLLIAQKNFLAQEGE